MTVSPIANSTGTASTPSDATITDAVALSWSPYPTTSGAMSLVTSGVTCCTSMVNVSLSDRYTESASGTYSIDMDCDPSLAERGRYCVSNTPLESVCTVRVRFSILSSTALSAMTEPFSVCICPETVPGSLNDAVESIG